MRGFRQTCRLRVAGMAIGQGSVMESQMGDAKSRVPAKGNVIYVNHTQRVFWAVKRVYNGKGQSGLRQRTNKAFPSKALVTWPGNGNHAGREPGKENTGVPAFVLNAVSPYRCAAPAPWWSAFMRVTK